MAHAVFFCSSSASSRSASDGPCFAFLAFLRIRDVRRFAAAAAEFEFEIVVLRRLVWSEELLEEIVEAVGRPASRR
jgi:hypothetical protein